MRLRFEGYFTGWIALSLLLSSLDNYALSLTMSFPTFDSLSGACSCGKVRYGVSGVAPQTPAVDCHCPQCRKYHVSAFSSFLLTYDDFVEWRGEASASYRDTCDEKGRVDRLYCSSCHSKVATRLVEDAYDTLLLCMGSIEDASITEECGQAWKSQRRKWQSKSAARWTTARADWQGNAEPHEVTGRCSCGGSSYRVKYGPFPELQHCYCKLCRNLSGSAFMTWVPVPEFEWTSAEKPPLIRLTDHGRRHICPTCHSVLTIVYDSDPDSIWPAAGGFDDASLPTNVDSYLTRVVHICCAWKQKWYRLPDDGLKRIQYVNDLT